MPPQIKRPLLIFAGLILAFLVLRIFLIPASFGKYGFYRADSMNEIAAKPLKYAGQKECATCHADIVETKASSKHASLSCETCHGPALAHVENPGETLPFKPTDGKFCLTCHQKNDSRPAWFPQVDSNTHGNGKSCLRCHQPHHPKGKTKS